MILLTGASGFLGKAILTRNPNEIISLGRASAVDIICDLSREIPELPVVDTVVHAAGRAHFVPKTEGEKQEFFNVNVTGTENLLKGLASSGSVPRAFVFISSVSVYGMESGINIGEGTPLLAKDAYGMSKIKAEYIVQEWCSKYNVVCAILRLPLIAGPNPPGNLGAMIKGIQKGYYLNIAGGKAKKSMVLSDDIAKIIPAAGQIGGIYNLTDGCHPSFLDLSDVIAAKLGRSRPLNIPKWLIMPIAKFGDWVGPGFPINSRKVNKIVSSLTFNDTLARQYLNWKPKPVIENI